MAPSLLVYGATGYVGENVARASVRAGLQTIAAGRDATKLDRIAKELGIESRVFGVEDMAVLDGGLKNVAVVLNCAGPFKYTAEAIADACMRCGAHYLDITGEIPVFEALHARDVKAKVLGVMLLPGVGFDVVPTDCLALYLKQRLPTASHLTLAFQTKGPAGLPPGTQRTAIELLHFGDRIRRDGLLQRPENPRKSISVDFGDGPVKAQLIPWGDVFTAYFSTGIPNIEDYVAVSPSLRRQMAFGRAIAPLLTFSPLRRLMLKSVRPGASAELRALTRTRVWGEAVDPQGRRVAARLQGPEAGLDWTVNVAVGAARKALTGIASPGYQTPASAFGADFVFEGEGVTLENVQELV